MPRRAARPCSQPGCPNLVFRHDRRFCDVHQSQEWKKQDAKRGTSAQRGYGQRWREIRDRYLTDHPFCEKCGDPATIAHHIVRKRQGGRDAADNLIALCQSCHSRLHAESGESFAEREGRQNR